MISVNLNFLNLKWHLSFQLKFMLTIQIFFQHISRIFKGHLKNGILQDLVEHIRLRPAKWMLACNVIYWLLAMLHRNVDTGRQSLVKFCQVWTCVSAVFSSIDIPRIATLIFDPKFVIGFFSNCHRYGFIWLDWFFFFLQFSKDLSLFAVLVDS